MNKREAKRMACRLASIILDRGNYCREKSDMTDADYERLQTAWDDLSQELWERGNKENQGDNQ